MAEASAVAPTFFGAFILRRTSPKGRKELFSIAERAKGAVFGRLSRPGSRPPLRKDRLNDRSLSRCEGYNNNTNNNRIITIIKISSTTTPRARAGSGGWIARGGDDIIIIIIISLLYHYYYYYYYIIIIIIYYLIMAKRRAGGFAQAPSWWRERSH